MSMRPQPDGLKERVGRFPRAPKYGELTQPDDFAVIAVKDNLLPGTGSGDSRFELSVTLGSDSLPPREQALARYAKEWFANALLLDLRRFPHLSRHAVLLVVQGAVDELRNDV